jgi:hypothetical protein
VQVFFCDPEWSETNCSDLLFLRHRRVPTAPTTAKVVENPRKPTKIAENTKKTVEIPDLPLTSGAIRPHREHR